MKNPILKFPYYSVALAIMVAAIALGIHLAHYHAAARCITAAADGNPVAELCAGQAYFHGRGVSKDYESAAVWYAKSAKQGNSQAQYALGFMYENGLGVPREPTVALAWYSKAAAQGSTDAEVNLAWAYLYGIGAPNDYAAARHLYGAAASSGDPRAKAGLAFLAYKGLGVSKDYAQAAKWYAEAAEAGIPSAQYNLGLLYGYGQGVPKNRRKSMALFYQAAEEGDMDARRMLGGSFGPVRLLFMAIYGVGGALLLVAGVRRRGMHPSPSGKLASGAGVVSLLAAGISWYGYATYHLHNLIYGLNLCTGFYWAALLLLVVTLIRMLRVSSAEPMTLSRQIRMQDRKDDPFF